MAPVVRNPLIYSRSCSPAAEILEWVLLYLYGPLDRDIRAGKTVETSETAFSREYRTRIDQESGMNVVQSSSRQMKRFV